MGLFNFFKKKPTESAAVITHPLNANSYIIETLKNRIASLGHKVERHKDYLAIIVEDELEASTAIVEDPTQHPNIIHLMVLTTHKVYFPNGIVENIAGFGTNLQDKVDSVLDNYLKSTFAPVIDGFSDAHNPALDFTVTVDNKQVLWHPKLGNLLLQGDWDADPESEPLFAILKEGIKAKLTANKFNWLKVYILKKADGSIIGECLFNNAPWPEGLRLINNYANAWQLTGDFRGLKQFMVFRRCDACDN